MNIKAIETAYKGYRFRSRLEARWAVYLDELGVEWKYEPEGYELDKAGRYLPDFYLPTSDSFIEVKPSISDTGGKRLYLAGKFTGGSAKNGPVDWRSSSFGVSFDFYGNANDLPICGDDRLRWRGFIYSGPHPIDLSSGHGDAAGHFQDFSGCEDYEMLMDIEELYGADSDEYKEALAYTQQKSLDSKIVLPPQRLDIYPERRGVLEKCLANIACADIVFAWISSEDCYGTLAEIGYAKGLGKRVLVGVSRRLSNMETWFSQYMADVCVVADHPREAFELAMPLNEEEEKAKQLAIGLSKLVAIVYGEPWQHNASLFYCHPLGGFANEYYAGGIWGARDILKNVSRKIHLDAASVAKSARFEHGEKPY